MAAALSSRDDRDRRRSADLKRGLATAAAALLAWAGSGTGALASRSAAPSCGAVPASEIKAVLGVAVPAPTVSNLATVVDCTYGVPGAGGALVIVRFQTHETTATFTAARKQFDAHGEPTQTFAGLGLAAYSSVLGSGAYTTSTLVVLKGGTELLVTAPTPLAKVVALVKKILPRL